MSSSVTRIISSFFGFCCDTESGSLILLLVCSTSTSEEFAIRKNTRIVKMSISETRFNVALFLCFFCASRRIFKRCAVIALPQLAAATGASPSEISGNSSASTTSNACKVLYERTLSITVTTV